MNSFNAFKSAFVRTFYNVEQVLRRAWVELLLLLLISELVKAFLKVPMNSVDPAQSATQVLAALQEGLVDLLISMILVILVPVRIDEAEKSLPRRSVWDVIASYTVPLTVEGLRAAASVLIWTLAFIIPGVYKYLRYSFIPYVIIFDPEYKNSDTLKRSSQLTVGVARWIFLIAILELLIAVMIMQMAKNYTYSTHAHLLVPLALLKLIVSIYSYAFAFNLFRERLNQVRGEKS